MIDVEAERVRFEAWFLSDGWPSRMLLRANAGFYLNSATEISFKAWLAAKRDAEQEAKS